ncbi:hypothetical protein HK27_13355 [Acetobacter orientalis]|nr:hypothetical protein HK27_13355 [Acetobacter orientalis]
MVLTDGEPPEAKQTSLAGAFLTTCSTESKKRMPCACSLCFAYGRANKFCLIRIRAYLKKRLGLHVL